MSFNHIISPTHINNNLYTNIQSSNIPLKNPYNLELYSIQDISMIKAGLKWEDGNWNSNDLMTLKQKLMYCYVRKQAHWDLAVQYNNYSKYFVIF